MEIGDTRAAPIRKTGDIIAWMARASKFRLRGCDCLAVRWRASCGDVLDGFVGVVAGVWGAVTARFWIGLAHILVCSLHNEHGIKFFIFNFFFENLLALWGLPLYCGLSQMLECS